MMVLINTGSTHHRSPITTDLFKYMKTDGLSENQKQRLLGQLESDSQSIRIEFATLVHSTEMELKGNNVNARMLKQKFHYYDASLTIEFTEAGNIEEVFFLANDYWSFFNYDLLAYVIDVFNLSKQNLESYKEKFVEYCQRRLCECESNMAGSHNESGRRIVMKLDDKMSIQTTKLQDLRRLQDQASKVTGVPIMQLLRIEAGCLHLIYRIPHKSINKINSLSEEQKLKLAKIGILSVTCEKKIFKWQIESSSFKRLANSGEAVILKQKAVITEFINYQTDVTFTLGVAHNHLRMTVDVNVSDKRHQCDKLSVRVIPSVHYDKEALTLPIKEALNPLQSFSIDQLMSLDTILKAKADMLEFYTEFYIQSSIRHAKKHHQQTSSGETVTSTHVSHNGFATNSLTSLDDKDKTMTPRCTSLIISRSPSQIDEKDGDEWACYTSIKHPKQRYSLQEDRIHTTLNDML